MSLRESWTRQDLAFAPNSTWRYSPALPIASSDSIVSLGEGMTPLLPARRTGRRIAAADLRIKDEGLNPTGSFKARGMSCAVSMCVDALRFRIIDELGPAMQDKMIVDDLDVIDMFINGDVVTT